MDQNFVDGEIATILVEVTRSHVDSEGDLYVRTVDGSRRLYIKPEALTKIAPKPEPIDFDDILIGDTITVTSSRSDGSHTNSWVGTVVTLDRYSIILTGANARNKFQFRRTSTEYSYGLVNRIPAVSLSVGDIITITEVKTLAIGSVVSVLGTPRVVLSTGLFLPIIKRSYAWDYYSPKDSFTVLFIAEEVEA